MHPVAASNMQNTNCATLTAKYWYRLHTALKSAIAVNVLNVLLAGAAVLPDLPGA
jgi:hypothetical protein